MYVKLGLFTELLLCRMAGAENTGVAHRPDASATQTAQNSALIPRPKLEPDGYDWYRRHEAVKTLIGKMQVDLVFLGDSITHKWEGVPETEFHTFGDATWKTYYGHRNAINMGFGWDRIQNVLWRLNHRAL